MSDLEMWVTPLLFLPGVGLLIMSTSIRYGQIHSDLKEILRFSDVSRRCDRAHLLTRSTRFRNALVSLYVSVACFALASLFGGIAVFLSLSAQGWIVAIMSCLGILFLVFASIELIRESILSLEVIEDHVNHGKEIDGS